MSKSRERKRECPNLYPNSSAANKMQYCAVRWGQMKTSIKRVISNKHYFFLLSFLLLNYFFLKKIKMTTPDNSAYSVFKQDGSQQFYCRWTAEEDMLLSKAVAELGLHKWTLVSSHIPGRTAVQCSTRWFGALK